MRPRDGRGRRRARRDRSRRGGHGDGGAAMPHVRRRARRRAARRDGPRPCARPRCGGARPRSHRCRRGRARPTFDEVGVIGWFRARLDETPGPARPQRDPAPRGRRPARPARPVVLIIVLVVGDAWCLRTFRLAEPYQMHFDEVYHARTATEFLQAWRYGLSHDIYEWTHPHLAKYAMAGGHRRCGARTRSAPRATWACRCGPRRSSRGGWTSSRPAAGPASASTSRPATEIRTYDLAHARADRAIAARRGDRPGDRWDRRPAGHRLRRRTDRDARPRPDRPTGGAGRRPGRARRPSTIPSTHLLVTDDGGADRRRVGRPADRGRPRDRDGRRARSTCRASPTWRPGGSGSGARRRRSTEIDRPGCARRRAWRSSSATDAADYEAKLDARLAGATVVLGAPGTRRDADRTRHGDRRRRAARRRGRRRARVAVATADGVDFIDPAQRPRCLARSRSTAGRTAWRS